MQNWEGGDFWERVQLEKEEQIPNNSESVPSSTTQMPSANFPNFPEYRVHTPPQGSPPVLVKRNTGSKLLNQI